MAKSDPLEQLYTLNAVLERMGVADPGCASDARSALEFYEREFKDPSDSIRIEAAADQLMRLHLQDRAQHAFAFAHWHVPTEDAFDLLWVRQQIIEKMKGLAGKAQALFLVTGLRESVCPPEKYWTGKREKAYRELLDWVNELICAWAGKGSHLQVVIL